MSWGSFEVVGIENYPNFGDSKFINVDPNKVSSLKYDQQMMIGIVPVVAGVTANLFDGEFGVRAGIGIK